MKNGQDRKGNWRWAAAALAVLLAACAAPSSRSGAPAPAPAAPAATAPSSDAASEAIQSPTAQAPAAAEAPAASATVDALRIAPSPSPLATAPSTPAPATELEQSAATQAPSLTLEPVPTASPIPLTSEVPTAGAGGAVSTQAAPSATSNPTPLLPTAVPTEAASSTTLPPVATRQIATETPIAQTEALSVTKAVTPVVEAAAATVAQVITTETRIVELEWPPEMRLGNTDIVRVSLVPSRTGYIVETELPGNTTVTQTVEVSRPDDYEVFAVSRLDGAGFTISPAVEQEKPLVAGQTVDWRWSIEPGAAGQHRLALVVKLRWVPVDHLAGKVREADLFSTSLTVQVASVMGMSTAQASSTGLVGLLIGSGLGLFGLAFRRAPQIKATLAQVVNPNASLKIEPHAAMQLADDEIALLRTLFAKYDRVVVENEFRSGYSGARTFLVHPIHADGRADAFTIAKMGGRASIQREFDNYQRFVKDTLPPITARIQEPPVTAPAMFNRDDKAVLRYTFIGEQGRMPVSLREALLAAPDHAAGVHLIQRLFETFGPNWWMQRKPYVFRLAQEYDRMLPAHFVIEPVATRAVSGAKRMDGRKPAEQERYGIGDVVVLQHFPAAGVELRADGRSLSLRGEAAVGQPPLRVRWMGGDAAQTRRFANGTFGRIVGTRETLLREWVTGPRVADGMADLHGLPDPISRLPGVLNERVQGTQSTIHGDLNLENGLVGPGGFVWLIDFAETRDGHTLYDFAHLEAEIIAHVIAPGEPDAAAFVKQLRAGAYPLLESVHGIAANCLFNPAQMREYWLVLGVTCLGATKYSNLTAHQQHLLFLTAAYLFDKL